MNRIKTGIFLALIVSLCGCGRSTPLAPEDLLSIRILPEDPQLHLEQFVQLTVEGHKVDGSVVDLSNEPDLVFRLNQDGIINVLSGAKIQALQAGSVRLMAAFGGKEDTVEVTVLYALLEGIRVEPGQLQLNTGDYLQLAITGDLSDGSTLDLTGSATGTGYVTADQLVATVTTEGMVFALKNGQTEITATHGEHQAVATVTVGELELLEVLPVQAGLEVNQTVQLQVFGTYKDGAVEDLTGHADTTYTSSEPGVASVDADGLVTGVGSGEAAITVGHRDKSAVAYITVTGTSELIGIQMGPCPARLSRGGWLQLEVFAEYNDGSRLEITPNATYSSSDELVASVDAAGRVTAAGAGEATITAAFGGFEDSCRIQVDDRILTGLDLQPDSIGLVVGETLSLLVLGTFNDGSQDDLTGAFTGTTYSSSAPAVVTVSPDGVLSALSAGEAVIEATNSGLSDSSPVNVIGPELVSIDVEPELLEISAGDTANLVVWANYSDLTRREVTADATYRSSDSSIVRVSAGGAVTAVTGPGEAQITASYGGYSDECLVRVGGDLLFIDVLPPSAQLDVNDSLQLAVMAFYSDGQSIEVTRLSTLESSAALTATVDGDGMVTALSEGTAVITATYQSFSDTSQIRVNPPVFDYIQVEPDTVTLPVGYSQQLIVWAYYSDGSRREVTSDATYLPPENGVVAVTSSGLVTALMEGEAPVLVSYLGEFTTCLVIVTSNLLAVEVEPASALLDPGDTQQLKVTAYFLDGSTADVTDESTYSTSDGSVASADAAGLVTALGPGSAVITAGYGGRSDTCRVQVLAPTLLSIEVAPKSLELEINESASLTVTAHYSDGSDQEVTPLCIYQSTDESVATVTAGGLVEAVAAGNATIRATYGGLTDTCSVAVGQPQLVSLRVEPQSVTLDIDDTVQLTVWATYSDNSVADVTSQSSFRTSDFAVASVSAAGLVTAEGEGLATATAGFETLEDGCQVQVNPPELVAVEVFPANVTMNIGDTVNLFVRASYSDGSTQPVTLLAGYDSSDPLVASVDSAGVVTANSGGTASITASYGGLSDDCQVRVNAPELVSIDVEPESADLNIGGSVRLTVWANYSDGGRVDVTISADFESSDPLVAEVQGAGLVVALAEGPAVITATYQTLTDTCNVSVQQQNPQPALSTVTPGQVLAGSGDAVITLEGNGFVTTSTALLDSLNLATTFIDASQMTAVVPAAEVASVGAHDVAVYNPAPGGGLSNTLPFYAVSAPAVTTLSPDSGLQGTVVRVVFYGSGLLGCSVNPQNPGIAVSGVAYSGDGTQLSATFGIGAAATPGTDTVTLQNAAGSTSVDFTVIEYQPLQDLVIGPGEVVFLSGVQSYDNIVIGTGAKVYGTGTVPLQFLAAGDVTVRGEIHASGHSGDDGYYDPATGGASGPGGAGGGGGADGDAVTGAPGGDGSPAGLSAEAGQGSGTTSGDGGGLGFGSGVSGGCGQAGGGGGFGGDGGDGGGDAGAGSGGPGGLANSDGSDYNGGTGGGGGSCCGDNSGAGGGGGGGVLVISAVSGGNITIDGALYADGGSGGDGFLATGGGGGGSGGRITITTEGGTILINDTVSVRGGHGGGSDAGDAGGGGGGGRIIVDAGSGTVDDTFGYYDIRGGDAGTPRDTGFEGLPGSPGLVDVRP